MSAMKNAITLYCQYTKSKFIGYSNQTSSFIFENEDGVLNSFSQSELLKKVRRF